MRFGWFKKRIVVWLQVFLFVGFLWGSSEAIAGTTGAQSSHSSNRREDMRMVLSVLESKMDGERIPEKARDKLFTLEDGQLRLMASLSEVIAHDGRKTSADFAFLLITALIVLS